VTGRFAPSPTGPLHVGSLRTALIAWLLSRAARDRFLLRIEDLQRTASSDEFERSHLADLGALGIDWDGEVWHQSERAHVYDAALGELERGGLTYECYCSRREIREAAVAPHDSAELVYPGTCRNLTAAQREERRGSRVPAIRFRATSREIGVDDLVAGPYRGRPWDVVLRRNDGVCAYNLAVVVDDGASGVDLVVRGGDLLPATPSQIAVGEALGLPRPRHAHVGLVVNDAGVRIAKRDGAISLADLAAHGVDIDAVRSALAVSIGLAEPGETVSASQLTGRVDRAELLRRARGAVSLGALLPGGSSADR
jgi:glutamyl-tRNA synthetase